MREPLTCRNFGHLSPVPKILPKIKENKYSSYLTVILYVLSFETSRFVR